MIYNFLISADMGVVSFVSTRSLLLKRVLKLKLQVYVRVLKQRILQRSISHDDFSSHRDYLQHTSSQNSQIELSMLAIPSTT